MYKDYNDITAHAALMNTFVNLPELEDVPFDTYADWLQVAIHAVQEDDQATMIEIDDYTYRLFPAFENVSALEVLTAMIKTATLVLTGVYQMLIDNGIIEP